MTILRAAGQVTGGSAKSPCLVELKGYRPPAISLAQAARFGAGSPFPTDLLSLGVPAQGIAVTAGVNFEQGAPVSALANKAWKGSRGCGNHAGNRALFILLEPGCQVEGLRPQQSPNRQPAGTISTYENHD